MESSTSEFFQQLITVWASGIRIGSVTPLTPDASLRRYFRLHLNHSQPGIPETVVAMVFDSVVSPEAGGGEAVPSDEAYVQLTRLFLDHKIPVPKLFFDGREKNVLLIEDLGDVLLGQLLLAGEEVEECYKKAINVIIALQKIPEQMNYFAFKRFFSKEQYLREVLEFDDYVLQHHNLNQVERGVVAQEFSLLCSEVAGFSRVLAHRDYHSWNLLVGSSGEIRVIDFQDALLAPRCYDIVGLLNDRDTDSALGQDLYQRLLDYFSLLSTYGEEFRHEYDRVLLQRDLKVVGRFSKLSQVRGLVGYTKWIPGTLQRIGRTLQRLSVNTAAHANFYDVLCKFLMEIR